MAAREARRKARIAYRDACYKVSNFQGELNFTRKHVDGKVHWIYNKQNDAREFSAENDPEFIEWQRAHKLRAEANKAHCTAFRNFLTFAKLFLAEKDYYANKAK